MKKKIAEWVAAVIAGIFVIFLIGGLVVALECHGYGSSEAAGWMQAIGAIAAILAAIWVSYDQHRKTLIREQDKERRDLDGMIRSLRSEVEILWSGIGERIGSVLKKSDVGSPLMLHFPVAENPFKIYDSCAGRIGAVEDDELRKLVLVAYSQADGVLQSIKLNNTLIEEFNRTSILYAETQMNLHHQMMIDTRVKLCVYGDTLRIIFLEFNQTLKDLMAAFQEYEKSCKH